MRRPVRPGQIYVDCASHPVLCTFAEPRFWDGASAWHQWWHALLGIPDDWDLMGISLLDGSRPRSCSAMHCGPRRTSLARAVTTRDKWEQSQRAAERGETIPWVDPRA